MKIKTIIIKSIVIVFLFILMLYLASGIKRYLSELQFASILICMVLIMIIIIVMLFNQNKKDIAEKPKNDNEIHNQNHQAIKEYYGNVNLLNKRKLNSKPWFLFFSPDNIDIDDILETNGTEYSYKYPENASNVRKNAIWRFSKEAVWIEFNADITNDIDQWKIFIESLVKIRKRKTLNGMVVIFDINKINGSEDKENYKSYLQIKNMIEEFGHKTGLILPLYLMFHNVNEIPGFNEFSNDNEGSIIILGKTFYKSLKPDLTNETINLEINNFINYLSSKIVNRLSPLENEDTKKSLLNFLFHMCCIQKKILKIVNEMYGEFKAEAPIYFKGFYFTACLNECNTELNRNDKIKEKYHIIFKTENKYKKRSVFILPLLKQILPNENYEGFKSPVQLEKDRKKRRNIFVVYFVFILSAFIGISSIHIKVGKVLTMVENKSKKIKLMYHDKDSLHIIAREFIECLAELDKYKNGSIPTRICYAIHNGKKLYHIIHEKTTFVTQVLFILPVVKYIERQIKGISSNEKVLTVKEYSRLSELLKIYKIITCDSVIKINKSDLGALKKRICENTFTISEYNQKKETEEIIVKSIDLYMDNLKNGEGFKISPDNKVIAQAENKISVAPDIDIIFQDILEKKDNLKKDINIKQIIRKIDSAFKTNSTINSLYTGDLFYEILDAINNYNYTEYIDIHINEKEKNDLKEKLKNKYVYEYKKIWTCFIESVLIDKFDNLEDASMTLKKLTRNNKEIDSFFIKINHIGRINEKEEDLIIQKAQNLIVNKSEGILNQRYRNNPFVDDINNFFTSINLSSSLDNNPNYQIYKKVISVLPDSIDALAKEKNYNACIEIENNLKMASVALKNIKEEVPEEISNVIYKTLSFPIINTGKVVSEIAAIGLNKEWKAEIYDYYKKHFFKKYPFDLNGQDASFEAVEDFFRPKSGIFWEFCENKLNERIVCKNKEWYIKECEFFDFKFNPHIADLMKNTESITNILFKKDGTQRINRIDLFKEHCNNYKGYILLNEKSYEITDNCRQIKWPDKSNNITGLRILKSSNEVHERSFIGVWGLLKMMDNGVVQEIDSRTYNVKWQFNCYGMYTVFYSLRVTISNDIHPFFTPCFQLIKIPENIISIVDD